MAQEVNKFMLHGADASEVRLDLLGAEDGLYSLSITYAGCRELTLVLDRSQLAAIASAIDGTLVHVRACCDCPAPTRLEVGCDCGCHLKALEEDRFWLVNR